MDYPVHRKVMALSESYGVSLTFSLTGIDRNVVSGKLTTRFFPSKLWEKTGDVAPLRRQKEENWELKATLGYKDGKPVLQEALSQTNKHQTNKQTTKAMGKHGSWSWSRLEAHLSVPEAIFSGVVASVMWCPHQEDKLQPREMGQSFTNFSSQDRNTQPELTVELMRIKDSEKKQSCQEDWKEKHVHCHTGNGCALSNKSWIKSLHTNSRDRIVPHAT